jgi:hypothetical protein
MTITPITFQVGPRLIDGGSLNKMQNNPVIQGTITYPSVTGGKVGTFTANGATAVTVANTGVTANSMIIVTLKTVGGTVGAIPAVQTITAGTGFTVNCTASDTSVYNYMIIESA